MSDDKNQKTDRIQFDYLKSPSFRSIHVDGVVGGITPTGQVQMAFYSERSSIPRSETYQLDSDGNIGQPIEALKRAAIVREVESNVVMSRETAEALKGWLTQITEYIKESDTNKED